MLQQNVEKQTKSSRRTLSVCLRSISSRSMCLRTSSLRGSSGSVDNGCIDSCISLLNSGSLPAIRIHRWVTISGIVILRAGSIVNIRFMSSSHSADITADSAALPMSYQSLHHCKLTDILCSTHHDYDWHASVLLALVLLTIRIII